MGYILSGAGVGAESITYTFTSNEAVILIDGTFDTESVTFQLFDGSVFKDINGATFSTPVEKGIKLYSGAQVRAVVSSGAGSPSINVRMEPRYGV